MTPESAVTIIQQALHVSAILSAPVLLTMLAVGLVVGMIQAATSINEMTLSFIPKMIAVGFVFAVSGHWMIGVFTDFARRLIESIPSVIG